MIAVQPRVVLTLAAFFLVSACSEDPAGPGDAGMAGSDDAALVLADGAVVLSDGAPPPVDAASTPPDAGPALGSAGCGMSSSLATAEWVEQTLDVAGMARTYFVWLPDGYDAARAYPVVYQFHGCSDSATRETNNPPVQRESGADAIHVRGRAAARCWDTAAMGPDVAFFDALVAQMEATYCADPERRFVTGYSSGAFMTHRLACVRGDVIRGVASIAGGQTGRMCEGQVAALLIHDQDDGVVNITASRGARDALLAANGCDVDAPRTPTAHSPCEQYAGCDSDYPVVWCETMGMNHSRQDALAAPAFWDFLSALP